MSKSPSNRIAFGLALVSAIAGSAPALAGTDDLRVSVTPGVAAGVSTTLNDNEGSTTDGVATKGVVSVDYTVSGTAFTPGRQVGTLTLSLSALANGAGVGIYSVNVAVKQMGSEVVVLGLPSPNSVSVQAPGSNPASVPGAIDVPVSITADAARVSGLAACVDGVPPEPLVQNLSFSNGTSGRNKLGNGPNVQVRVTLDCRDDEVVFCTASQGCLGQPGGQVGGDIALCNDPLAGWLTRNAEAVLPLTVGRAHELQSLETEAGSCAASAYDRAAHDGQGSGIHFQTLCNQAGVIAYLPAGSTPRWLERYAGSNREIGGASDLLRADRQGSGSRGSGGGVLTGQTLTLKLGLALGATANGPFLPAGAGSCVAESGAHVCAAHAVNAGAACDTTGVADDSKCFDAVAFIPGDLAGFTLPDPPGIPVELCTQIAGQDRKLEETGLCGPAICNQGYCDAGSSAPGASCSTDADCPSLSDDVCEKFVLPDCVAGATVGQVLSAAEEVLSGVTPALCGGVPSTLSEAQDRINNAFDGCGKVIDCSTLD